MFLLFNTYNQAFVANAVISLNMRLSGSVTIGWAEIGETADGKFYIPKPEEKFLNMVEGYEEVEKVEVLEVQE